MRKKTASTGLVAVILAAGGFAGGVQVQKQRGTEVASAPVGMPASFTGGGGPPGAAASSGDATTGTVKYTEGDVLYVEDAEGNTVKVKVRSRADVTRTASTDSQEIQPGDSVVVEGAANSKGTVTATAVTATEAQAQE